MADDATAGKRFGREKITDATAAVFTTESVKIPDERFIRTEEVHAAGAVVGEDEMLELPVVDMASLVDPGLSALETAKLGSACREWGFFQLTNHGVEEAAIQQMKDSAAHFFSSPLESKNMVAVSSPIESKNTVAVRDRFQGFGHHFNGRSSEKLDWAECLILLTQPVQDRIMDLWPLNPPTFRYSVEIRDLARRLLGFMATDLGVSQAALLGSFFAAAGTGNEKGQSMSMHHYPPCRHPDKVVGITPHTDSPALTFLLHVDDTPGLQVKRGGRWFPVRPLPGALVVNVGDILDVLTNGVYISVEHRVVPDVERGRTTVAMFHYACVQGLVTPLPELLLVGGGDAKTQARYRSIPKLDYLNGSITATAQGRRFADSLIIRK